MQLLFKLIHSFIHSRYFYSASSSPLLLRGAPDRARILCRSFTPRRHRQLRVKDLPMVPTWRLERDSNPGPSGRQLSTLPMGHRVQRRVSLSLSLFSLSLCLFMSVCLSLSLRIVACVLVRPIFCMYVGM